MSLAPGAEFAGYTIESVLGTGGMGTVYLAKHPRLPRRDALKLLNPAFSADPDFRTRFEREADLAATLIHRNIVAVYDRGSVDGQLWIAMQYVAGTDAAVVVRNSHPMPAARAIHVVAEVGAGLDYAHRAGLLHRDVKPANVLLAAADDPAEPEYVLLTDFGIAKSADEVQRLTGTGNLLATLPYVSPEQVEAKPFDHRVDIYALGCVLYELLTGSVPFPAESPFAIMNAHMTKPPPRPSDAVPGLPAGLDDVVAKAMAKDPGDRFATCRELSVAARAALLAADPGAASPTTLEASPPAPTAAPKPAPGGSDAPGGGDRPDRSHGDVHTEQTAAQRIPVQERAEAAVQSGVALTAPRPPYTLSVRRTAPAVGRVSELGPVSTNYLSATHRIQLEELLHRARFFDLPPRLPLEYVVPGDVFQEITVASDKVTRVVGYEREGARHPAELDEVVSLLERMAGWQQIHLSAGLARHPGEVPATWTPTGNVPPLGALAAQETVSRSAVGGPPGAVGAAAGTGAVTGTAHYGPPAGTGPHPPLVTGAPPNPPGAGWPPGPTGGWQPPGPPQQQTGPQPLRPAVPAGATARSRRWWIIGAAAAVVAILAGVSIFLLTRSNGPEEGPPTPTGLSASVDGRTVTVRWDASSGASGYTLRAGSERLYVGPNTTFTQENVLPGTYEYTVTASNVGSQESAPSPAVSATVTHPWGDALFIVDEFPGLLPPTPTDKGYGDATCSISSDTEGSGADHLIGCTDPNGVYFEVMHFPEVETKDTYLQERWSDAVIEPWTTDGVEQGQLYRSADDESTLPFVMTTFNDPDRANYLVYVHWSDHTTQQLVDEWWKVAPF